MPAIFPRWTNHIPIAAGLLAPFAGLGLIFAVWYWFSPNYTDVGYRPEQPVPYSHKLHAGDMGLDCRYCHNTVESADHAAIPPAATCLNCHETAVKAQSNRLAPIREAGRKRELAEGEAFPAWEDLAGEVVGKPVEWVRVHQLPDYAYFSHQPHVAAGVGCASCHGRVDRMVVVEMAQPLSMGWCLECHRNPAPNLRPLDQVTNMNWSPEEQAYDPARDPERKRQVSPPLHCSGCHR